MFKPDISIICVDEKNDALYDTVFDRFLAKFAIECKCCSICQSKKYLLKLDNVYYCERCGTRRGGISMCKICLSYDFNIEFDKCYVCHNTFCPWHMTTHTYIKELVWPACKNTHISDTMLKHGLRD
jgi:hypothetical protein